MVYYKGLSPVWILVCFFGRLDSEKDVGRMSYLKNLSLYESLFDFCFFNWCHFEKKKAEQMSHSKGISPRAHATGGNPGQYPSARGPKGPGGPEDFNEQKPTKGPVSRFSQGPEFPRTAPDLSNMNFNLFWTYFILRKKSQILDWWLSKVCVF